MRVSSRRAEDGTPLVISRSKCFTHAMPAGNDHALSRLKPMSALVGARNQRLLRALSDQNGTLISYGTNPALAGIGCVEFVSAIRLVNAPVSARVGGNEFPMTTFVSFTRRLRVSSL